MKTPSPCCLRLCAMTQRSVFTISVMKYHLFLFQDGGITWRCRKIFLDRVRLWRLDYSVDVMHVKESSSKKSVRCLYFSPKQAQYQVIRGLSDVCTGLWIDFLSSSVSSAPFVMKVNPVDVVGYGTAPTLLHFSNWKAAHLITSLSHRCLQMAAGIKWSGGEAFHSVKQLWTTDTEQITHICL